MSCYENSAKFRLMKSLAQRLLRKTWGICPLGSRDFIGKGKTSHSDVECIASLQVNHTK